MLIAQVHNIDYLQLIIFEHVTVLNNGSVYWLFCSFSASNIEGTGSVQSMGHWWFEVYHIAKP